MAAGLLEQIISGTEKLPGNLVGAPIDLSNVLLNLAKAGYGYAGSKLGIVSAGNLPDINDDPIGGSKSINRAFGLGESKGIVDESIQFLGGLATPGNIGLAAKAVILPAALLHDASTVSAAGKLINAGREDQVYKATKIFQGTEGGLPFDQANPQLSKTFLKAVLPDTNVSLRQFGGTTFNPTTGDFTVSPLARNLGDVIDHPELFKAVPGLAETPVANMSGRGGSFNSESKVIKIGEYPDEKSLMSTILHETQHAIQDKFGFTGGSNPGYFLRDRAKVNQAIIDADKADLPTATKDVRTLGAAIDKAHDNYLNTGGELEAQVVQAQFTSGNYTQSPAKLAIAQAGGRENIINDISKVPKADDDPAVRAIVDSYNQF